MKPRFVIVGLGNPGKQYESTRHNVGYIAIDWLAKEFGAEEWKDSQKFLSEVADVTIDKVPTLLVKPKTFMNRSGEAIQKILTFYKLKPERLLVISDEIDLPPSTFRLKLSGGPGTHNGLKSIVDIFGEDFPRLRVGIGTQPPEQDLSAWILSGLTREEMNNLRHVLEHLPEVVKTRIENLKSKRASE